MCHICDAKRAAGETVDNSPLSMKEIEATRTLMAVGLMRVKKQLMEIYPFAKALADGLENDPLRRQRWQEFVTKLESMDELVKDATNPLLAMRFETITVEV